MTYSEPRYKSSGGKIRSQKDERGSTVLVKPLSGSGGRSSDAEFGHELHGLVIELVGADEALVLVVVHDVSPW
jgi:hypothetical protein